MVLRHSWVELSRSNLLSNIQTTRSRLSTGTKLFAVVKANAYGHGLKEIVSASSRFVDGFCLAGTEEALEVRRYTKKRIIVLSYFATLSKKHLNLLIERGIEIPIFDISTLDKIINLKRKVKVHLKIDTGATRIGFLQSDIGAIAKNLKKYSHVHLAGIFSHFAEAEKPNSQFTKKQTNLFTSLSAKLLKEAAITYPVDRHIACSAALSTDKTTHFDAVRLGIHLYGLSGLPVKSLPKLNPVLSWKSRLIQTKTVSKGATIGYNRTYKVAKQQIIGVIPVGYADGLPRMLSNKGFILINGMKAPIRGRVCMNLTMIDVTNIPDAKPGSLVTIIGFDSKLSISADMLAKQAKTINYEIVTRIHPDLKRTLV